MRFATMTLIASLGLLSACGASAPADGAATGGADSAITTALDQAWAKAKAGENPTMACAKVKGRAISQDSATARAALAQCNFDIPVRYFATLLDQVDAGTLACNDFMMTMATQLRPMTMSMGGLKHAVATSKAGGSAAQAGTASVIGGALGSASAKSASQRVKDSLRERAIATCSVMTMYMKQ